MLVLFSHVVLISKADAANAIFKYIRLSFSVLTVGGWSGVDLFFVLSGFLVSGLLLNEFKKSRTIQPGRFLIRRGFKIYPGFAVFLLLTFLVETFGANYSGTRFFGNDYIKEFRLSFSPCWSALALMTLHTGNSFQNKVSFPPYFVTGYPAPLHTLFV